MSIKDEIIDFYLDYVNDYLSVDLIAEHNEITVQHASQLIEIGREMHESRVKLGRERDNWDFSDCFGSLPPFPTIRGQL